jgi:hypothetical protein
MPQGWGGLFVSPSRHATSVVTFASPIGYDDTRIIAACEDVMSDSVPPYDQRLWVWLASTYELQTKTYGYDFRAMSVKDLAKYITWNVFAAHQELAEASVEFSWAPWATDEPFVNRTRVVDELIDVLHFVGNIMVSLGVTDEELAVRYAAKQDKNRRRVASGSYSKRKGGLGDGSDSEGEPPLGGIEQFQDEDR